MSLINKTKAESYKDILQMDNNNGGITTAAAKVKDGRGTESCISLSDDIFMIQPKNDNTTSTFRVTTKTGTNLFIVDTTNETINAGTTLRPVNTQVQLFGVNSTSAMPTSTNWTALPCPAQRVQGMIEGADGGTPATSFTIDSYADDMVSVMWYLPFNITIDACHVWFGGDESSGDRTEFSVMSYAVVTTSGSTGGDLSSGTEHCSSPLVTAGLGNEQAHYQLQTIDIADVDAGRAVLAFVKCDGNNSDLSVNMQLVYHCR